MQEAGDDDPFELFVSSTDIRYVYYKESHQIMGKTFGMCVLQVLCAFHFRLACMKLSHHATSLQDFEALTPNLLARTIETVQGGGIIVLLLKTMSSLQQLYSMAMDAHARFRTESHSHVSGRFNERFILSLTKCASCLVVDDELNVLPITVAIRTLQPVDRMAVQSARAAPVAELQRLRDALVGTEPAHALLTMCATPAQATVVLAMIDAIAAKTLRATVALTAARGRGKSAALGMSLAAAVAFGYANIFVTAPHVDNLSTLFEFTLKALDALKYMDFF